MLGMTSSLQLRIQKAGRRLRWLIRAMAAAAVLALAWILTHEGPLALVRVPAEIAVDAQRLSYPRALPLLVVGLLVPATWLVALMLLDRLFALYEQGIVFSARNVTLIRRTGYVLMAVDGVEMLAAALTGPVLTLARATRPYFRVELQVSVLLVGFFVVVIAQVMDLGRQLHEDGQLTI